MKKAEILKELNEALELISQNSTYLWLPGLSTTVDSVIREDADMSYEGMDEDEDSEVKYNGWFEKLNSIKKALEDSIPTREKVMIRNLGQYLGGDGLSKNSEAILEKLGNLQDEKGQEIFEDSMIEEFDVYIGEKFMYMFTVNQFIEQLDTFDYES